MTKYRIATLPGDGIGPEVMESSLRVLDRVASLVDGLQLEFTQHQAGSEHYRRTGEVLPRAVLEDCLDADAVFLAAIGLPDVRTADGTEVQPEMMVGLRRAMGLYAAVRPIKLFPGGPTPLANVEQGIDFVIIRENLEGLFASYGAGCVVNDRVATDTMVMTREGTERIADFAFRLAQRRSGRPLDGQHTVTCVDKSNVFRSFAFFRKIFFEVSERYPDIAAEASYVDAMSLYMLQQPEVYDVLVMENQFGDILSDLGAGLVGGLGLAPSAEVGDRHALFQPSHGSAPTIAGQDIANPLATILSGAMMLEWLSEKHDDHAARHAAQIIERSVAKSLAVGPLTRDLGGDAGTQAVGNAVAEAIEVGAVTT